MDTKVIGKVDINGWEEIKRVFDTDFISPTLDTFGGGNREPKIMEKQNKWLSQKGVNYILDSKRGMCTDVNANVSQPLTTQSNWTGSFISPDIERVERTTEIGSKEPTKITLKNGEHITSEEKEKMNGIRIRKLTPKECWRLMGFSDDDFAKAKEVNSDSQLYKQAGNSIVVDVLMAIFKEML